MKVSLHTALVTQSLKNQLLYWPKLNHPSLRRLSLLVQLNDRSPSLHFHYRNFITTMASSDFRSRYVFPLPVFPSDLPCSLSKPVSGSCCLYNGVRIAGKQVSAMLVPTSLPKSGFATRLIISSLHQQFTFVHLPDTHLPFY